MFVQVEADVVQFVRGAAQSEPHLRREGASLCLVFGEHAAGGDEVGDAAEDSGIRVQNAGDDLRGLGRGSCERWSASWPSWRVISSASRTE